MRLTRGLVPSSGFGLNLTKRKLYCVTESTCHGAESTNENITTYGGGSNRILQKNCIVKNLIVCSLQLLIIRTMK